MNAPAVQHVRAPTVRATRVGTSHAVTFLALAAMAASCGGEEAGGPLDPKTFAGMHQSDIAEDCDKTVDCKAQNGETLRKDDPVGHCILDTAKLLNDDKDAQESFLANYPRCRAFAVCDYVNCVSLGGNSYGDMQRGDVSHACTAEVECALVRGSGDTDPVVCQEKKVNMLNTYVPTQRDRWEASFDACKDEVGCKYVDCYNAAFFGQTGMPPAM
jgi:hypothetical protein